MMLPVPSRGVQLLYLTLLFWRFLSPSVAIAQPFRVDHIGVNDGLTQGSVYYILKDSQGFLWCGTQDGLNRYDGHQFRHYYSSQASQAGSRGIHGVNIFGIIEDPTGTLWVGTEEGLNRYDRQHDSFTYVPTLDVNGHPRTNRTLPFYADKQNLLYLSDEEGLVAFDYHTQARRVLNSCLHPAQEYDRQSSTIYTAAGDVWVHAPKGLVRYNLITKKTYSYFSDRPDNCVGKGEAVFSFYVDATNTAWIGTAAGLVRLDLPTNTGQTYTQLADHAIGPVYSIAEDRRGRLWVGTQYSGLAYFDKRTRYFGSVNYYTNSPQALSDFEISKVYVDNQDIVWANVDPNGLAKVVQNAFLFGGIIKKNHPPDQHTDGQLSNYTIRGFLEVASAASAGKPAKQHLWIATKAGIDVLDPSTNRVVQRYLTKDVLSDLPMSNGARCLYRDTLGRIWVGSVGGVYLFHPPNGSFEKIPFPASEASLVAVNYVRNLACLDSQTVVGATEEGIFMLDVAKKSWTVRPELRGKNIFCFLYNAPDHQLWVGTYLNGFFCYQLPTSNLNQPWQLIQKGMVGYTVLHMRQDSARQTIWLASDRGLGALVYQAGLNRRLPIRLYTTKNGLANQFVYGTLADAQNTLWMSTNRGISRFDPASGQIKNFDMTDGLQGFEFNGNAFSVTSDGTFWFGGVNGLNYFRPEHYRSSLFNPKVHLHTVSNAESPSRLPDYVGVKNSLTLPYNENTFAVEFAAIDYLSNGHNLYQYRLKGNDDTWVMAGERNYVRYANLPPGDYRFEVRAANKDGYWSQYVTELAIQIQAPFWLKMPFWIAAGLALSLLALYWVRRREIQIRRQQAWRLRLSFDIQEQVKKDIARDLHDEIGTRLATLKLYTARLAHYAGDLPEPRSLKEAMFSIVNETISDVRNLLRKLNPKTLEQYGYLAAVEELLDRVNASSSLRANLILDNPPPAADSPDRLPADTELMLYRITQELVSNTLKHANATRLELAVRQDANRLYLTYHDNGRGFDPVRQLQANVGLGIGNIESRVAMLSGSIAWNVAPPGILVNIDIPLRPGNDHNIWIVPKITRPAWIDPIPRGPL